MIDRKIDFGILNISYEKINEGFDIDTKMNEIEIYKTPDGHTEVEVQFEGDTFWLSQEQISNLFERDRTVITRHLRNIFKEGELDEKVVCANFAHTTKHGAIEGKTQENRVKYYNLDAILSVGLPGQFQNGHSISPMGNATAKRLSCKGICGK